jgi:putative PIN family toxin of toxin-antitoxin system
MLVPYGNPSKTVQLFLKEEIILYYSGAIMSEYEEVLLRPRLKIDEVNVQNLLVAIRQFGNLVNPPISTMPMPDETDRTFYDTAKCSDAVLITGNTKHYPNEVFIVTPKDYLQLY